MHRIFMPIFFIIPSTSCLTNFMSIFFYCCPGGAGRPAGQPAQAAATRLLACPGVQAQIFNTCSRRTILAWKEKRSTTPCLTQGKSKHGKLKTTVIGKK
jgi:hypothetical protein